MVVQNRELTKLCALCMHIRPVCCYGCHGTLLHSSPFLAVPIACLLCLQRGEEMLLMPRDKVNMDVLQGAAAVLNDALSNPFFGVL